MLTTVMTKEVVTTREALSVGAARDVTVEDDLGGSLLHVFTLMTSKVLRVEKPLTTRASVRPLITAKMYLEVATEAGQCKLRLGQHVDSLQFAIAIKRLVAAVDTASKPVLTRGLPSLRPALGICWRRRLATPRQVCVVNVGLNSNRLNSRRIVIDVVKRIVHRKLRRVIHEVQYLSEVHLTSVCVGSGRVVK